MRTRPQFVDWQLEVMVEVDANVLDVHTLQVALRDAGRYEGLCDMRPIMGRFVGEVEEAAA